MRKQYHFRPSDDGLLAWDIHRLVELTSDFPVKKISVDTIRELDEPYWFGGENSVPTCRAIADHVKLIEETDLKHPVILSKDGRVMDGMHRVAKALNKGQKWINVVQFTYDPEPDYIGINPDDLPYDEPADTSASK